MDTGWGEGMSLTENTKLMIIGILFAFSVGIFVGQALSLYAVNNASQTINQCVDTLKDSVSELERSIQTTQSCIDKLQLLSLNNQSSNEEQESESLIISQYEFSPHVVIYADDNSTYFYTENDVNHFVGYCYAEPKEESK